MDDEDTCRHSQPPANLFCKENVWTASVARRVAFQHVPHHLWCAVFPQEPTGLATESAVSSEPLIGDLG